jgi:hypothetical protein
MTFSYLTAVLDGLLKVLQKPDFPTPDPLPSERFCVLQRLVEEAIAVLEDLQGLAGSFLNAPPTKITSRTLQNQKVRRVAWIARLVRLINRRRGFEILG